MNDRACVYNVETQAWSWQTGLSTSYAWSGYSDKNTRMDSFFSGIDGTVYRDQDGTSYNGDEIHFEWVSKGFAFGNIFSNKAFSEVKLYGGHNGDVDISGSIIAERFEGEDIYSLETEKTEKHLTLQALQTTGNAPMGKSTVANFSPTTCAFEKKYTYRPCGDDIL